MSNPILNLLPGELYVVVVAIAGTVLLVMAWYLLASWVGKPVYTKPTPVSAAREARLKEMVIPFMPPNYRKPGPSGMRRDVSRRPR